MLSAVRPVVPVFQSLSLALCTSRLPCRYIFLSESDSSGRCLVGCCSLFTWRGAHRERHEDELRACCGCCCYDAVSGGSKGTEGVFLLTPTSRLVEQSCVLGPWLCSCCYVMIMSFFFLNCVDVSCHALQCFVIKMDLVVLTLYLQWKEKDN